MTDYLLQKDGPAFPKVLWNRPVSRAAAGTLTVIGGRPGDFAPLTNFYQAAMAAGIGRCRVALPDSLRPILAAAPDATFLPSGSGGGLSRKALEPILELAESSTAVVIGPGLGNSSDAGILTEALLQGLKQPVILMADALRAIRTNLGLATGRANHLIITTPQELLLWAGWLDLPIKFNTDQALGKLSILEAVTSLGEASYFVGGAQLLAGAAARYSLTPAPAEVDPVAMAAVASALWAQNPAQPFECLTTAAYVLAQAAGAGESAEQWVNRIKQVLDKA